MGNGILGGGRKPLTEEERRRPLTSAAQVLESIEAKERVAAACKIYPPGVAMRWEKILAVVNRDIEPTKQEMDPLRIRIDLPELKSVLRQFFHDVLYVTSDGLALCRTYMPKLFDKHNPERGKKVSQAERAAKGIIDECFAYGEVDYEIFATMYMKIVAVYGAMEGGIFYDLGCGVGTLVSGWGYGSISLPILHSPAAPFPRTSSFSPNCFSSKWSRSQSPRKPRCTRLPSLATSRKW